MPPRNRQRPGASMLTPAPESLMATPVQPAPLQPTGRKAADGDVAEVMAEPEVYLSGRVPKSLRDELRHQAIREGRSTVDLLKDAVTAYLNVHTRT